MQCDSWPVICKNNARSWLGWIGLDLGCGLSAILYQLPAKTISPNRNQTKKFILQDKITPKPIYKGHKQLIVLFRLRIPL
jgi:hypothetical protein